MKTVPSSNRNLIVIAVSLFMLTSGMSLVGPILPLWIQRLGDYSTGEAAEWSGLVQGLTFLMGAIFAPIWGVAGDRFGRKSMVLRAFFGMAFTTVLVGFARSPVQILLIRMVHGCLGGAISASTAMVSTMTHERKMASTMGWLHSAIMAGNVGGPLIGGVLADAFGFRRCFLITSFILFLCGLLVAFMVKENFERPSKEDSFSMAANFRYFFSNRQLLVVAAMLLLTQAARMGLNPILPLFIASIYKAKAMLSTVVGTAFAITGLTAALTVAYWGRRADRKGYRSSLFLTVGLTTLCLFSYPFARNLWHVYLIRLATGAAASGIAPILQSLIALNSVASRRGSIYGTVSVAHWAGNALGPLIAGYAARALGFGWAFAAMGFVGAASLAVAYGAIEEKMSPKSHHGKLENPEGVLAQ